MSLTTPQRARAFVAGVGMGCTVPGQLIARAVGVDVTGPPLKPIDLLSRRERESRAWGRAGGGVGLALGVLALDALLILVLMGLGLQPAPLSPKTDAMAATALIALAVVGAAVLDVRVSLDDKEPTPA